MITSRSDCDFISGANLDGKWVCEKFGVSTSSPSAVLKDMRQRDDDFQETYRFMDERLRLVEEAKRRERRRARRLQRFEEIRLGGLALVPWAVLVSTLVGAKFLS